ncbi:MAG: retropepsin-like aspartic protease [Saprospiraceae bacterium]
MSRTFTFILFSITIMFYGCSGCNDSEQNTDYLNPQSDISESDEYDLDGMQDESSINIPYKEQYGNTITIPVKINGMSLEMIYDTGASATMITLAEARYLFEKGRLSEDDIIDYQQYQVANGQIMTGLKINLKSVSLDENINLYNVEAVVAENLQAPLLLGQSVLKEFKEVSIDRENGVVKFYK